jgi:uncharacterized membrane protein
MPVAPTSPAGAPPHRAFWVLAGLLTAVALARYASWHSCTLDMAYYTRLVWGLGQGDPTQPVVDAPHWLGLHFEPVLLPFAGLSRLGVPTAPMLLFAQALAGAAVVYPAARFVSRRPALAGVPGLTLAVFLLPAFTRNLDFDFHPNTLAVWPLLAFVEALDGRRLRAAGLWLLLAVSCREDIALQGAAAALFFPGLPRGARLAFAGAGLAWFGLYALAVQPAFAHEHARSSFAQHFGYLGAAGGAAGVPGVLAAVGAAPLETLSRLVTMDRLLYPVLLVASVGFLPLRAPRLLAGALPVVGINLLSGFDGVRDLDAHYLTAATPFLYAAAVAGAASARAARRLLLAGAVTTAWVLGPGLPERVRAWFPDEDTAHARAAAAQIPPDAPVVAPSEVLAHLAERPRVYHRWFAPEAGVWRVDAEYRVTPPGAVRAP